jgi:hypothetical protein
MICAGPVAWHGGCWLRMVMESCSELCRYLNRYAASASILLSICNKTSILSAVYLQDGLELLSLGLGHNF